MLTYLHLDVFTDQLFAGNQLAVYLDPPHDLSGAVMQAIAREMAFSETTFVFPPDAPGTDYRVRIFTPGRSCPWPAIPPSVRRSRWRMRAASTRVVRQRCSGKVSVRSRSISTGRTGLSGSHG